MDGKVGEPIENLQQICADAYKIERLSLKTLAAAAKVKVVSMLPTVGAVTKETEGDPLEGMPFPPLLSDEDETWYIVPSESEAEFLDDWLLADEESNTTPISLSSSPEDVTSQALNFKAALLTRKPQQKCPYQALKDEALRAAIKEAAEAEKEAEAQEAEDLFEMEVHEAASDLESSTEEYDPTALMNFRRDIGAWKKTRNTKQVYHILASKEKREERKEAVKAKAEGSSNKPPSDDSEDEYPNPQP
eukprot:CAMPEP_0184304748 /NCGR_PEP_ID=MMETSP1049-20130417/14188_1 /TAXON_ID=77928 /ORGANISM="Proteomonas sulcata, Strain CCMP704" /LENGTH=246 /DNA_ID=CAMNT_0026616627 /DNA_START=205 /DNA_END=946 /DNA_ORIENTATION=-